MEITPWGNFVNLLVECAENRINRQNLWLYPLSLHSMWKILTWLYVICKYDIPAVRLPNFDIFTEAFNPL